MSKSSNGGARDGQRKQKKRASQEDAMQENSNDRTIRSAMVMVWRGAKGRSFPSRTG